MLAPAEELEWNEMSQEYLKCLSRYEKDFLCLVLTFLTLSLCALCTSWELSHAVDSPLASAPGFYSLPLLCKNLNKLWVFFFS